MTVWKRTFSPSSYGTSVWCWRGRITSLLWLELDVGQKQEDCNGGADTEENLIFPQNLSNMYFSK